MKFPKLNRLLVPDTEIIVVLDTAPVRNLAYAHDLPSWVETYSQMSESGYSFSLADGAITELLAQRNRGALSAADCRKIFDAVTQFINPQLPVMLGKKDLSGMLQINEHPWDEAECRQLSIMAWSDFRRCSDPDDEQQSPEWALQEERDDWIGYFAGWQKVLKAINDENEGEAVDLKSITKQMLQVMEKNQDSGCTITPSMSLRNHLLNRYMWRQFVRSQEPIEAYNPASPKKRNDGIDADLFFYLVLPALVVTQDGGFFGGLQDIKSFQKQWLFQPHTLAEEWLSGSGPAPMWP